MAQYTYVCPNPKCENEKTLEKPMKEGPPARVSCEKCKTDMKREYKPLRAVAFNAYQILLDWNDENYRRMRARKAGKHAPRFSPHKVKAPGAGLPGKDYRVRSLAYENQVRKITP